MPLSSPSLSLTRRRLIQGTAGLTALAALPGWGQQIGRGRLAKWAQWTRFIGPEGGTRDALTIRAYPQDGYAIVASWASLPSGMHWVAHVPDPGGVLGYKMFALYDQRPQEDLVPYASVLEDFCWLERTRLHEGVWTAGLPAAEKLWTQFKEHPQANRLEMPNGGTMVWIQPTNDIPDEESSHISASLEGPLSDHPLATLLHTMYEQDLCMAASPHDTYTLLQGTGLDLINRSALITLPQDWRSPFNALYLRMLTIAST